MKVTVQKCINIHFVPTKSPFVYCVLVCVLSFFLFPSFVIGAQGLMVWAASKQCMHYTFAIPSEFALHLSQTPALPSAKMAKQIMRKK